MSDDQLSLPLSGLTAPGAADRRRPELVVLRGRLPFWEETPSAAQQFCTVHEVLERVRLLGLMVSEGGLRDDLAPLWAAALDLAGRSPWAVRLARDLEGLHTVWTHGDVDLLRILRALQGHGGRHEELAGLLELLARMRARLAGAHLVDAATSLKLGLDAVEQGRVPPSLQRYRRLVIRHVVDPTELELKTLLALARAGLPMEFVLPLDQEGRGLTAAVGWIANEIEACHEAPSLEISHEAVGQGGCAPAFCDAWYSPHVQAAPLVADLPVRVEVARDSAAEARRIAGVVAAWCRGPEPMPRVAIALRTLDAQADRIEDALGAYGLPVARRVGRSLIDTPPGQVLLELFRLRRDGVPRDRLLALLSQRAYRGCLGVEEVGAVARTLRRAAARTDVEDSTRPTGGYAHRLERYALSHADRDPAEAEAAHRALEVVAGCLAHLDALPRRAPLAELLERTRRLFDEAVSEEPHPEAHARIRELLADFARSLARVDGRGDARPVELAAFRQLLLRALGSHRLPPVAPPAHHAVEIVSLSSLFGRTVDHVVIADCVHGRLPLAERTDPLLTETDRVLINQAVGERVLTWAETDPLEPSPLAPRQALEPLWFLGACAAATTSVLITAAGRDMRGRELAPSEFLQEALLALGASAGATSAGQEPPFEPHPRLAELVVARRVAEGEPTDVDDDKRFAIARFTAMSEQRRRWFQRGEASLEQVRAEWAYAVDPARMQARFGHLLGMSPGRPLTPTRLEALAACRFRGFVEHLLRVDTEHDAGQDADSRALGRLAHAVLERFYQERKEQDVAPEVIREEDRARLRALVWEEAGPMLEGRETGHLAALQANISWLVTTLTRTVTMLAHEPPVRGVSPHRFELNIGVNKPGQPATAEPVPIPVGEHTLWLGGEIDRVDKGPLAWVVVDYKNSTGSRVNAKLREKELLTKHFQLPLYLRLITHYVNLRPEIELAAYLISLRDGVASTVLGEDVQLRRRVTDDEADDGLAAGISRVILPLLQGTVPPDEGTWCRGCRVARVCRRPQAGAALGAGGGGAE